MLQLQEPFPCSITLRAPSCIHWATHGIELLSLAFWIPRSTCWACVHISAAVRLRQPATQTTVCPVWCYRPPWPLSRLWRAARPARSRPAAIPWQLPGICPSSPGSGVSLSPHAGCCPWQEVSGPWRGAGQVQAARLLCRAGWAFDLSHRCGGGCTGLQGETRIFFWNFVVSFE